MSPVSSVPLESAVRDPAEKRRRFWRRLVTMVLAAFLVLPTVLQTELLPQRADVLQGAGGGAGGGKGRASHAVPRRQIAAQTRQPFYGAVRDAPLSALETLSNLRARGATAPRQANLELENPQVESFAASEPTIPFSGPLAIPDSDPTAPIGAIGGVAPPVSTGPGDPITPPIVIPPVVAPPVITPPVVTPPVVTPPIGGPTTPPVVTPPDNPPVTPPVVIPPDPPPTDPGLPIGPIGGGPGGPGPPIPEPATWIQLILGAAMVGAVLRRRRTQPLTALRARSSALAVVSRLG